MRTSSTNSCPLAETILWAVQPP
ncbi:unnamed protein product, partial [Allacma fusca]